jgi:hypothetical protein
MIHVLYVNMIIPRICTIHSYVPNRSIFSTHSKSWKVNVDRFLPIENRLPFSPSLPTHIYYGPSPVGPRLCRFVGDQAASQGRTCRLLLWQRFRFFPFGCAYIQLPLPQFTDQWSRFLGLTRSLQRRWKFREFSGYFSVIKMAPKLFFFFSPTNITIINNGIFSCHDKDSSSFNRTKLENRK